MSRTAPCPKCQKPITVPDSGNVRCWACGTGFRVGGFASAPALEPLDAPGASGGLDDDDDGYQLSLEPVATPAPASSPAPRPVAAATPLSAKYAPAAPTPEGKLQSAKKKRKKDADGGMEINPMLLIGVGAGVGVLLIGMIAWAFMSGGDDKADEPPGMTEFLQNVAEKVQESAEPRFQGELKPQPVVFDKPVPDVAALPPKEPEPHEVKPDWKLVSATPIVEPPGDVAAPPQEAAPEPARWQAEVDPPQGETNYTIAPDLQWELTSPGKHPGSDATAAQEKDPELLYDLTKLGGRIDTRSLVPPILAAHNGPYVIIPPTFEKFPYSWKLFASKAGESPKYRDYKLIEHPHEDLALIDIRTGQSVGTFDWRIPFWLRPVLSPDGMTLVGPYHILQPPYHEYLPKETEKETARRHDLHVWRRGEKGPKAQLSMSGELSTYAFADNQTLLVLVEKPKRQLEIWNTADGKRTAVIDVPHALEFHRAYTPSEDFQDMQVYPPAAQNILAVSPGGRYAALLGGKGLLFISLQYARIIGGVPLPDFRGKANECVGLEFLPKGDKLVVAYFVYDGSPNISVRMRKIDITNGTTIEQADIGGPARGPLVMSPDERSFLLIDYPADGLQSSQGRFYDLDKKQYEYPYTPITILRYPAAGPLLVVRQQSEQLQPGEKRPGAPETHARLESMPRETHLAEVEPLLAKNEQGLEKRVHAPPAERTAMARRAVAVPETWKPVPPWKTPAPPPAKTLGSVVWPIAWGDAHALTVIQDENRAESKISARVLNLAAGEDAASSDLFPLLSYGLLPNKRGGPTYFYPTRRASLPAGMTAQGDRFAIADPDQPGRVEVWSSSGKREFAFRTSPKPKEVVIWTDFGPEEQLLTVEDGVLSAWRVDGGAAKGIYAVAGGYQLPVAMSPDRSLVVASRAKSFDVLSAATGECLARCALADTGMAIGYAFCPDGKQLAVLYEKDPTQAQTAITRVPQGGYSPGVPDRQLAIWNLEKGAVQMLQAERQQFGQPCWLDAEHLAFEYGVLSVFDLKLQQPVLNYTLASDVRGPEAPYFPTEVSPDGRLWYAVPHGAFTASEFSHSWRLGDVFAARTPEEQPFFAADRKVFELQSIPIRLELDLKDKELAEKRGPGVLKALQEQGWKIGTGGGTMKVEMTIGESGNEIEFASGMRIHVPILYYGWRLLDASGTELAANSTAGHFPFRASRYATTVDLQTRREMSGDSYYDFGIRDPRTAMIEEILDSAKGLTEAPKFPKTLMAGGGKYIDTPKTIEWSPPKAEPPAAE